MTRAAELNILHVLRAPVGGLFRHVLDLARGQAARGHRVGIVADASTGSEQAQAKLAQLAPALAVGVTRVPMSRHLGPRDIKALLHVRARAREIGAQVIHGHGAKGGVYARLAQVPRAVRVYTPHGGSLHYTWRSPAGILYLRTERALTRRTDLFLFESKYGRDAFLAKVGEPAALTRVVHNGVTAEEFEAVSTEDEATDLVFVGELRALKGVDLLIEAVAILARQGSQPRLRAMGRTGSIWNNASHAKSWRKPSASSAQCRPAMRSRWAVSWWSAPGLNRFPTS
jgi:glycosyltransferase involved in cell wall biosynthesis